MRIFRIFLGQCVVLPPVFKVGRPAALKIDDVMSEIYQKSLKLKGSVSHKVKLILKKIRLNLN